MVESNIIHVICLNCSAPSSFASDDQQLGNKTVGSTWDDGTDCDVCGKDDGYRITRIDDGATEQTNHEVEIKCNRCGLTSSFTVDNLNVKKGDHWDDDTRCRRCGANDFTVTNIEKY